MGLAFAVTIALIATTWLIWPGNPPLYDGLPLSVPPYRYLDPPPGLGRTPPPTSAAEIVQASQVPYGFLVHTSEDAPQASAVIPVKSLALPNGADSLAIRIDPVQPPAPLPRGHFDGNVYRIGVVDARTGDPIVIRPGRTFTVTLRHTGAPGTPALEQYADGRWRVLKSVQPAPGHSEAAAAAFGSFALTIQTLRPAPTGGLGGGVVAALVVTGCLFALALVLFLVRRRSH